MTEPRSKAPSPGIRRHSEYGSGRVRMQWDHDSGYVDIGITEDAMKAVEFWLRLPVQEARDLHTALATAIDEARKSDAHG